MTAAPDPRNAALNALIGVWHTKGEVFGDDGSTSVATIEGTDSYEWLGEFFVIHRIEVRMGDDDVEGLEIIGAYDAERDAFPTRAYDNRGGVQTSSASVDAEGVWTFGADDARATLRPDADGRSLHAEWVRLDGEAEGRPWMRLTLTRHSGRHEARPISAS